MKPKYLTEQAIDSFIEAALLEDIGDGDHSSLASIPEGTIQKAKLLAKDEGILAGVSMAEKIFRKVDPALSLEILLKDGEKITYGDTVLFVEGNARSILTAERLVLNCMQRMSGIASYTHEINSLISHTSTQILDTRKTTPNFRIMEKWAVLIGGAINHRFGLYDMIMLKDNHIDYAGGIKKAVQATVDYLNTNQLNLKIEVETRNLEEVKLALETGNIDVIMLDNMSIEDMKKAVEMMGNTCKSEASGGITHETIVDVASTGVDYISLGALTHSAKNLDLSLKAVV